MALATKDNEPWKDPTISYYELLITDSRMISFAMFLHPPVELMGYEKLLFLEQINHYKLAQPAIYVGKESCLKVEVSDADDSDRGVCLFTVGLDLSSEVVPVWIKGSIFDEPSRVGSVLGRRKVSAGNSGEELAAFDFARLPKKQPVVVGPSPMVSLTQSTPESRETIWKLEEEILVNTREMLANEKGILENVSEMLVNTKGVSVDAKMVLMNQKPSAQTRLTWAEESKIGGQERKLKTTTTTMA
ncbi:hypothetical protein Ancab_001393 [Ancistrocladus abbreviatus]